MKRWVKIVLGFLIGGVLIFDTLPTPVFAAPDLQVPECDIDFYSSNDILYFNPCAQACSIDAAGSGGPANINVDKGFSLGTDAKERRVNLAKALMKDFGLSGEQASGIVGNFMHESGGLHVPPDINEGGQKGPPAFKGGYGWAQWTGPRQKAFIDFAVKNGYMASSSVNAGDDANYAWLKFELINTEKSTIPQLKTKATPEDAAISFEATFERAGVPALGKRSQGARQVFDELNGGGAPSSGGGASTGSGTTSCGGGATGAAGDKVFPLKTTKNGIKNRSMFANNTASKGGHPYTAYDILADPGVEVVAHMSGVVKDVTEDRCPGKMVSVFNKEANVIISYLHLNTTQGKFIKEGTVTAGQRIGEVGPGPAGCGTPHLHIDAAQGEKRPGCSRLNCPASNASKFIDMGPDLFKTFQALPE